MIDQKEFAALISLLDDHDMEVHDHVTTRLISYGTSALPMLMAAWEKTMDTYRQERIELIIHSIQLEKTLVAFEDWTRSELLDPLEGALLIARYQYPDMDEYRLWRKIDRIKHDMWLEMTDYISPIEQINIFNHVFYRHYQFNGKNAEREDPQSYYLNHVIESKKGNSLSLGMLYLAIARQLGIPVYGLNLPGYFCLAYMKNEVPEYALELQLDELEREVLFYINPLNNGLIFSKHEITTYLNKLEVDVQKGHYLPVSTRESLRLLVKHLQHSYEHTNAHEKAEELEKFLVRLQGL